MIDLELRDRKCHGCKKMIDKNHVFTYGYLVKDQLFHKYFHKQCALDFVNNQKKEKWWHFPLGLGLFGSFVLGLLAYQVTTTPLNGLIP